MPPTSGIIGILTLLTLLLTTLLPSTLAQYLPIDPAFKWNDWSWDWEITPVDPPPLFAGDAPVGLPVWKVTIQSWGALSFHNYLSFGSYVGGKYENFVMYLEADTTKLALVFRSETEVFETTPDWPLSRWLGSTLLLSDTWTKVVIPESEFRGHAFDRFHLKNTGSTPVTIHFAGYFGPVSGPSTPRPPPTDLPMPYIKEPWNFVTLNQSNGGETGLMAQFYCEIYDSPRIYSDLWDVQIHAFRDTTVGTPVPLNTSNARWNDGWWDVVQMFREDTDTQLINAQHFPHPALACALWNADFFEIGNREEADTELVVWAPELSYDLRHVVGAYAAYVKDSRKNGRDSVVVHLRTRIASIEGFPWVGTLAPNCTEGAPNWQCPDHIWFTDTEMGALHVAKDRLFPLSAMAREEYRETGYDVNMNIHPAIFSLTSYGGVNYAMPVYIQLYPWQVNQTTIEELGLQMPPPVGTGWGSAWWQSWNFTVFNRYLEAMAEKGYKNTMPLPVSYNGDTILGQFLGYPFGANMLTEDGRCGIDKKMELAFNKTLMSWLEIPGAIQQRYAGLQDKFAEWLSLSPDDIDPLEEPIFGFKDAYVAEGLDRQPGGFNWVEDLRKISSLQQQNDEDIFKKVLIYPPTGAARLSVTLAGIPVTARNPQLAWKALMGAVAQNDRLHVNTPTLTSTEGGVSGYLSARYSPEYQASINIKNFWNGMLDHVIFNGYPAEQSPSFGLIAARDPMQVAINNIVYKGVSAADALARACKIIDYVTMPPCGPSNWEAYLLDDRTKNKATVVYQWHSNQTIVCRLDLAGSVNYPAPIKNFVSTPYISTQSRIGKLAIGMAGTGMVLECALIAMFIWQKNAIVIRAASRPFSNLILLGACFTLGSVIARTTPNGQLGWWQCYGTYWLFGIGFALNLGSLAMKTYRVDRIFHSDDPSFKLPDWKLGLQVGAIVFFEVVFLLVFQIWRDGTRVAKLVNVPQVMEHLVQEDCPVSDPIAVALLYAYNAFIILVAAIVAFRTRNVDSAFNENIYTISAIGLISVVAVIVVPVLSLITEPEAIFMLISLGTIFATILSTLVFALPKVLVATGMMKSDSVATTTPTASTKPTQPDQKYLTDSMSRFADYRDDVQMSADVSRNASGDPLRSDGGYGVNSTHGNVSGNLFDRHASREAVRAVSANESHHTGSEVVSTRGTRGRRSSGRKSVVAGTDDTTV
ncbi:hypothetical protein HK097_010808 [Rhizophlyctis rosea]|uniref:G-protein coupled receptors family 3 profile domain-containing protein n=1 Tax=Rhizophlyctis rosea TaxID=64517 RepID=A0AAD5S9F3_9FUNG|nr:hypothetical protein HK097_010808 [Rhizophlyctis rosea]